MADIGNSLGESPTIGYFDKFYFNVKHLKSDQRPAYAVTVTK